MNHLPKIPLLFILAFFVFSCQEQQQTEFGAEVRPIEKRDLASIKKDGKLKALVVNSSTSYFLYHGQPMGFEYELLERFADYLEVELEIEVSDNIDSLLYDLNHSPDIDIVAYGLSVTSERKQQAEFTDYLYLTHQVLVQKKPDDWRSMRWSKIQAELVDDAIELIGDTVAVRKGSSYAQRLENLSEEIGGEIAIEPLSGKLSTDEIIKKVVNGEIEYTIADNNIASINASYYPVLDIDVPMSFSQRVSWAVSPQSSNLLSALNKWLAEMKSKAEYYVIYNKYFKNKRRFRQQVKSEFYSLNENKISKYDEIIQKSADKIDWDWRLLASLVYQESRFKIKVKSWAGAKGLMQLMPSTAKSLGVQNPLDPKQNIQGGAKYLDKLWNKFEDIPDSVQRIKFTMAAYNCGYYHVSDARKLAEKRNLNPNEWDNNVEKMILALSYPKNYNLPFIKYGYVRGIEPHTYVEQIFKRYEHYQKFIESEDEELEQLEVS